MIFQVIRIYFKNVHVRNWMIFLRIWINQRNVFCYSSCYATGKASSSKSAKIRRTELQIYFYDFEDQVPALRMSSIRCFSRRWKPLWRPKVQLAPRWTFALWILKHMATSYQTSSTVERNSKIRQVVLYLFVLFSRVIQLKCYWLRHVMRKYAPFCRFFRYLSRGCLKVG